MSPLDWLAATAAAAALRASPTLYLIVNATHILGIGLILGAILPLDLRLMGFFRRTLLPVIGPFLVRAAATGVILALSTGLALFAVKPLEYLANSAFVTKLALLAALAGSSSSSMPIPASERLYAVGRYRFPSASPRCSLSSSGLASCSRGAGSVFCKKNMLR
ncbi:hypothetical protein [Elstera litoralis]|uniref:hypothetical protein n=1 Tax=Elstera litoralis TaxID=552518 RepID=UPI000AE5D3F7|nr:hypothetical protein [Elstera litoralis]